MRDTMTRYRFTILFEEPGTDDEHQRTEQRAAILAADLRLQTMIHADPDLQRILADQQITMQMGIAHDVPQQHHGD